MLSGPERAFAVWMAARRVHTPDGVLWHTPAGAAGLRGSSRVLFTRKFAAFMGSGETISATTKAADWALAAVAVGSAMNHRARATPARRSDQPASNARQSLEVAPITCPHPIPRPHRWRRGLPRPART